MLRYLIREYRMMLFILMLSTMVCNGSNIVRNTCSSNAVFYLVEKGYKPKATPIKELNVTGSRACIIQCMENAACKSFAIKPRTEILFQCSLYNIDQQSDGAASFESIKGWDYYDTGPALSKIGNKCRSLKITTCRKRICVDKCNKLGYKCIYGKSCKDIRERYRGTKLPNGFYQLAFSNGIYTVYCDMKTLEGGWLLTSLVNLTTTNGDKLRSLVNTTANFNSLGNIAKSFVMSGSYFKKLHQEIKFTQIRFYCRKEKVGRSFHISIFPNATDVIDWYLEKTPLNPKACGTFMKLPDDNSNLASECNSWFERGVFGPKVNFYEGAMWVLNKYHWNTLKVSDTRYECDDLDRMGADISIGDTWKIYVR